MMVLLKEGEFVGSIRYRQVTTKAGIYTKSCDEKKREKYVY